MTVFRRRSFCSLVCANSRGVRSMSSSSQHRISAQFRKEQCDYCGKRPEQTLHVHHKNEDWTDHRDTNLQTLCHSCHMKHHHPRMGKCCTVIGCVSPSRKRRMCQKHFQRWKRHGDPLLIKQRERGSLHGYVLVMTLSLQSVVSHLKGDQHSPHPKEEGAAGLPCSKGQATQSSPPSRRSSSRRSVKPRESKQEDWC